MPSVTLNEMILGYAVILGVLVLYSLTLIIRIHKAKKYHQKHSKE